VRRVTSCSATTSGSRAASAVACSTILDTRRATFHVINRRQRSGASVQTLSRLSGLVDDALRRRRHSAFVLHEGHRAVAVGVLEVELVTSAYLE
jgi:hypothetical protein